MLKIIQHKKDNSQNLFSNTTLEVLTKVHLLPEFKKVDYFLKIDNCDETISVSDVMTLLNTIDNISTNRIQCKWIINY